METDRPYPHPRTPGDEPLLELVPTWQRFFLALGLMGVLGVGGFPFVHLVLGRARSPTDLGLAALAGVALATVAVAAGRRTRGYLAIREEAPARIVEVVELPWRTIVTERGALEALRGVELGERTLGAARLRRLQVRLRGEEAVRPLTPWAEEAGGEPGEPEGPLLVGARALAARSGLELERVAVSEPGDGGLAPLVQAALFLGSLGALALLVSRLVAALGR